MRCINFVVIILFNCLLVVCINLFWCDVYVDFLFYMNIMIFYYFVLILDNLKLLVLNFLIVRGINISGVFVILWEY